MGDPGVDEVCDVYDVYDVAIIGYGPSGQVAAGLLGQAGLKVWVAERLPDVYEIPRAISMDHEVLRVLQQLGVLEAIAPYFEPFTPSEFFGVDGAGFLNMQTHYDLEMAREKLATKLELVREHALRQHAVA